MRKAGLQSMPLRGKMEQMTKLSSLIAQIEKVPDCRIYPAQGLPHVESKYGLPDDVSEFFALCGGIELFTEREYPYTIVTPVGFVRANPVIIREYWYEWEDDISSTWHIIASDPDGQFLTIDLDPGRLGRCYDSFIGQHANPGDCPIIAESFSDLLSRLVENQGRYPYWLAPDFRSLGDAYDTAGPRPSE